MFVVALPTRLEILDKLQKAVLSDLQDLMVIKIENIYNNSNLQ